jgi:hypothetical protein
MSLRNKIIEYLKVEYPRIVHKGDLGKLAVLNWGYENENLGRRCRELEDESLIKRFEDEKGRVMYQYIKRYESGDMVADKKIFYKNLQGRLL